jgi:hypothetical protein
MTVIMYFSTEWFNAREKLGGPGLAAGKKCPIEFAGLACEYLVPRYIMESTL